MQPTATSSPLTASSAGNSLKPLDKESSEMEKPSFEIELDQWVNKVKETDPQQYQERLIAADKINKCRQQREVYLCLNDDALTECPPLPSELTTLNLSGNNLAAFLEGLIMQAIKNKSMELKLKDTCLQYYIADQLPKLREYDTLILTLKAQDQDIAQQWLQWYVKEINDSMKREGYMTALQNLIRCLQNENPLLECNNLKLLSSPPCFPSHITRLNLQDNQLYRLNCPLPPKLVYLSLKNTQLLFMPTNLPDSLEELNLSNNGLLHQLPEAPLPALKKLLMSECNLSDLTHSQLPPNLEELDLYKSRITALPANIPTSLRIVNVNNNELLIIPESYSQQSFERFDFGNNPATSVVTKRQLWGRKTRLD